MSFKNLNLNPSLLSALDKCGYTTPTPIQQQAIPCALAGKDLIATAQTGTGKTAAFVLPALEHLLASPKHNLPRILILTPTRELAYQVTDAVHKYGSHAKIKAVSILGGVPYPKQLRQLSQPVDIIVATPGRLIDYLKRKSVNLSQVKMLVLDEADRMLDMGFIDAVKYISQQITAKRQTLLFTATLDERITKLASSLLHSPEHITVAKKSVTLENIKQHLYFVDDKNHKDRLLQHLLGSENIYKGIIFSATKHNSEKLAKSLCTQGYAAAALNGDMNQRKRDRTINDFRKGPLQLLVATDLASRGIDINDLTHVINYDLPRAAEDYVHRIGRTGRAGKNGIAISLVLTSENMLLKRIERYINSNIPQQSIPGLEPKHPVKQSHNKPKRHNNNFKKNNQQRHRSFKKGASENSSNQWRKRPSRQNSSAH